MAMMLWQLRAWREAICRDSGALERQFARRRFRRRTAVNILIALLGLAIPCSFWIVDQAVFLQKGIAWYGLGVTIVVLLIVVLALFDWIDSRIYYSQRKQDHRAEQATLEAQLKQVGYAGNGHDDRNPKNPKRRKRKKKRKPKSKKTKE